MGASVSPELTKGRCVADAEPRWRAAARNGCEQLVRNASLAKSARMRRSTMRSGKRQGNKGLNVAGPRVARNRPTIGLEGRMGTGETICAEG